MRDLLIKVPSSQPLQILCYGWNIMGSSLMQVMSEIADYHMEPQDQELATFSDMRAGGYDGRGLLQVSYCTVPSVTRFNNGYAMSYKKRRGDKQMLQVVWIVKNKNIFSQWKIADHIFTIFLNHVAPRSHSLLLFVHWELLSITNNHRRILVFSLSTLLCDSADMFINSFIMLIKIQAALRFSHIHLLQINCT